VIFVPQPVTHPTAPRTNDFALTPAENGKSRTTFILLGVLLGAFGAHNFYAGYRNKAFAQLLITVLTLGFASPMSWMWAVIDVCTITEDSTGVKFKN
jgi:TM2 domain-containing membrane protein YozV